MAYTGTSITSGSSATAGNGYVDVTNNWLRIQSPFYSFINMVNDGYGGSTSWYGLVRLAANVIAYSPDVVVIEYTPNDQDNDFYKRCGEAMVRRLRTGLPNARLAYISFTRIGNPAVDDATNLDGAKRDTWLALCSHYGVSFYDFGADLVAAVAAGGHCAIYMADTVHPTTAGHLMAHNGMRVNVWSAVAGGPMPGVGDRLYDNGDFENDPIIRNGIDNDAETGTWAHVGNAEQSSTANSTMSWIGTFQSFGLDTNYSTGAGTFQWKIDDGDYSASIDLSARAGPVAELSSIALTREEHTLTIKVISGTVKINRFLAI